MIASSKTSPFFSFHLKCGEEEVDKSSGRPNQALNPGKIRQLQSLYLSWDLRLPQLLINGRVLHFGTAHFQCFDKRTPNLTILFEFSFRIASRCQNPILQPSSIHPNDIRVFIQFSSSEVELEFHSKTYRSHFLNGVHSKVAISCKVALLQKIARFHLPCTDHKRRSEKSKKGE